MAPLNVVEYSADQYCVYCQSIFLQGGSAQRHAEPEEELARYGLEQIEASWKSGCVFCDHLVDDKLLKNMKRRKQKALVLDLVLSELGVERSKAFEQRYIDHLEVLYENLDGSFQWASSHVLSTPTGS